MLFILSHMHQATSWEFYDMDLAQKTPNEIQMFLLAKDMSPPNPSLLLLEMVELGELL